MTAPDEFVYTKSNRLIEFLYWDNNYFRFLVLKAFALLIDYIIVLIPEVLLMQFSNLEWFIFGAIGTAWMISYCSLFLLLWKRTIGMIFARLYLTHSSGLELSGAETILRAAISGLYAFPIVGWALMFAHLVVTPFWKGITLVDFFSRTNVVTRRTHFALENLSSKLRDEALEKLDAQEGADINEL